MTDHVSEFEARLAADMAEIEANRKAELERLNPPQPLSPVMQVIKGQEAGSEAPEAPQEAATQPEPAADAPEGEEATGAAPDATGNALADQAEGPDETAERIKRAHIEAREAKRKAAQLERELAILRGEIKETPDEQVQRLAQQQAQQIAIENAFASECNKVAAEGEKTYKDFMPTFNDLCQTLGGFPRQLVESAIEAGDPHKALHWLGKNLDEAERIAKLSPARQGVALAKIVDKLNTPKPKPVTKAPPPIKAAPAAGPVVENDTPDFEKMSMQEFAAWQDKHDRQRRSSRFN